MPDKIMHNYLKVESKDEDHPLTELTSVLGEYAEITKNKNSPASTFGFFRKIISTDTYIVLQFDPKGEEYLAKKEEEIRQHILGSVAGFLYQRGYIAKPFDLEGMIKEI